ncbi:site-specific recombinase XerD [Chryseobacterium sp. 7]|uniref:phage integrase SAM-like domain-containing protein n=1 Tax=Chryseobacterium sp. 7 TaxID=2035214 RepID=UPI000EB5087F|nr:phage integrase SAM-like domain-containing protein [Chryseobacterium sp. 7]RLJ30836.1 site-specific recombinase XerD [Chryseobacterium sp. 7]
MNVNFYLKEPKSKDETLIHFSIIINGSRVKRSTGVKVKPNQWSGTKVKPLAPNSENKNLKLENIQHIINEIERDYLRDRKDLTIDLFRNEFDRKINPEHTNTDNRSFSNVIDEFIKLKTPISSENTIKAYNTLKKTILEFEKEKKYNVNMQSFNLVFNDYFQNYLIEKEFLNSTINKYCKNLKAFLNWTYKRGYHNTTDYKQFDLPSYETDKVVLTAEVIEKLRTQNFKNELKNCIRDIFILSCYTGLRYIDISLITKNDYDDKFLNLHIKKTRENLTIPLLPQAKAILDAQFEHFGKMNVPPNQTCNRILKDLFEEIEFTHTVKFTKHSGGNNIILEQPANKFITVHYGRSFFITNSLTLGMNEELIRKITGHKDYKSFKKYVNFSKEMVAENLHSHWNVKKDPEKVE